MSTTKTATKKTDVRDQFTLVTAGSWKDVGGAEHAGPFGVCYDYAKHSNAKAGNIATGKTIYINRSQYVVVDVDMHVEVDGKKYSNTPEQKEAVRQRFIGALSTVKNKFKIVKTGSGGLHIYCKWDNSLPLIKNQHQRIYECTDTENGVYSIDLFAPVKPDAAQIVVLPGTVALNGEGYKGKYEWIQKCEDKCLSTLKLLVMLFDVQSKIMNFDKLKGAAPKPAPKPILKNSLKDPDEEEDDDDNDTTSTTTDNYGVEFVDDAPAPKAAAPAATAAQAMAAQTMAAQAMAAQADVVPKEHKMNKELWEIIKTGIEGIKLIGDWSRDGDQKEEATLNSLFNGAYGCICDDVTKDDVEDWLADLKDNRDRFTDSAWKQFNSMRKSCRDNQKWWNVGVAINMIKYHNKDYYESAVVGYYLKHKKPVGVVNSFDIYEDFDLDTIEETNYKIGENEDGTTKIDYNRLDNDIRKLTRLVRTDGQIRYIYKDICAQKHGQIAHKVRVLDDVAASKLFSSVALQGFPKEKRGGQMKLPTLWSYVSANPLKFKVKRATFWDPNDEETFNLFSGYAWKAYTQEEMSDERVNELTNLHQQHWLNQFCSGHQDQFDYLLNWWAKVFQEPDCKNTTCLTHISKQGTGKNRYYVDEMQELLTNDYFYYTTDVDNVMGKFNSPIEYKKVVVMDETADSESGGRSGYSFNYDRFKGTCTAPMIDINEKTKPQRIAQNVFNGVILSNNQTPFKIQDTDRRMVLLDMSNEYANLPDNWDRSDPELVEKDKRRKAYFTALENERSHPDYFRALFTLLMRRDVSKFMAERDRPFTERKTQMLESSKTPVEMFVEAYITKIASDEWTSSVAYDEYKSWATRFGYGRYAKALASFESELKQLGVDTHRKTVNAKKSTYVRLTATGERRYKKLLEEAKESDVDPSSITSANQV